jgi:outer membrane protein assembly factor BamD (BamD/ComL family)
MTLLDEAQKTLSSDPAKALSLCDKDAAANPRGSMAQEREVIAIDALMRLKREPEARTRAERFHASWPDSAHGRRVDALVNLH